ncbi:hypothetical protein Hdeb2414_s0005g00161411 [Helianthus debilis subsp. tardiflorus]
MPTSTYPKEWKNRFIFVSAAMLLESPTLRDPKASIDKSVPVLSANDTVLWKRMHENTTRAYNFPEGVLAMGGPSPLYSVRLKAYFGKKEMTLWGLLQGDCRGIKFMVGDVVNPEMGHVLERKAPRKGSFVYVGGFAATERGEETPSHEEVSSKEGSSKAPIVIPAAPAFSQVKDKAPETSVAHTTPATKVSPLRATSTSKLKQPEDLFPRSPLARTFTEGLRVLYVPKWKITPSTIVGTPETAETL